MNDLIFISAEDWDTNWHRSQFLCAEYARRYEAARVLFVTLSPSVGLRQQRMETSRVPTMWSPRGLPNLTVTRPVQWTAKLPPSRRFREAQEYRHIRIMARQLQMENPILWINTPDAAHLAGKFDEVALIYEFTDLENRRPLLQGQFIRQQEQDFRLCQMADAVIVSSERLYQRKLELNPRVHLIPNGVDTPHFRRSAMNPRSLPPFAKHWPRPVLGCTGRLNADCLDLPLLEEVARNMKCGSLVFIGANSLSPTAHYRLTRAGNVYIAPPIPYNELPRTMHTFDISIAPYRITEFTENLDPPTLYDYLAIGKPIIATAVAGFRAYPDLVQTVQDSRGFLAAIPKALRENPLMAARRREEAECHGWDVRFSKVEAILQQCVTQERPRQDAIHVA